MQSHKLIFGVCRAQTLDIDQLFVTFFRRSLLLLPACLGRSIQHAVMGLCPYDVHILNGTFIDVQGSFHQTVFMHNSETGQSA